MNDLITEFHKYFEIVTADTAELENEVFRMRYKVYCEELGDLDTKDYPDGLERDEYDRRSVHYLLRHRGRDEYVGAVRLILPNFDDLEEPCPLELNMAQRFYQGAALRVPRQHTAEISRFMLTRSVRSRPGESETRFGTADNIPSLADPSRRRFPHPVLGLVAAVIRMSAEHHISHWYAGMEPVLNRLLRRFGLQLEPIGPLVQYHGRRQPFLGAIEEVLRRVYTLDRRVWGLFTENGLLWPEPRAV